MNEPEKNLNKQDYIDSIRKGRIDWHYNTTVCKEFFKVSSFNSIKSFSEKMNAFIYRIVGYNLNKYLELNEYTILDIHNLDVEEDSTPTSMRIEISPGKYSFIYKRVQLFLKSKSDQLYILSVEREYDGSDNFSVTVESTDDSGQTLLQGLIKYSEENNFYKKQKIDAKYDFIKLDRQYTWDDAILPEEVKNKLLKNIQHFTESVDIYKANNIQMKRGIILKGIPGVGKTLIGKILCSQSDWSFIWIPPQYIRPEIVASFCDAARKLAPTILFLEDLDLYSEDRESNVNKSLLGQLMNELDGIQENNQILVVATTNKIETLESAMSNRPGRFDIVVELPSPSEKQIFEMLTLFTKTIKLESDVDLSSIAKQIASKKAKYSGAHVKEVINLAILNAIDDKCYGSDLKVILKQDHLLRSIDLAGSKKVEITGFKDDESPSRSAMFDD